jgi:predicted acetyltransferase
VSKESKHILENMYQFYLYDFSQFTRQDLNINGLYDVDIEYYWQDPRWNPYFINLDGTIIGFLVVLFENFDVDPDPTHVIYDFMILRKYRRKGFGKEAAITAFNLNKADWTVAQMNRNEPAIQFWRNVIKEYTRDSFTEVYREDLDKYFQSFSTKDLYGRK